MSQKSLTAPGTGVLFGILLPPTGFLVIGVECSAEAKNGPQTSAASYLREGND